jgi:transcription-repair coupling factor (superfamily II helicase)
MTSVRHEQDVEKIEEELRDRFGEIPRAVSNSLGILKLRIKSAGIGVEAITHDRSKITIKLAPGIRLAPDVCIRLRKKFGGCVFMADRVLVDSRSPRLLKLLGYILDDLPAELEDSKLYFMAMI